MPCPGRWRRRCEAAGMFESSSGGSGRWHRHREGEGDKDTWTEREREREGIHVQEPRDIYTIPFPKLDTSAHQTLDSQNLKSHGPETYLSHSSLCRTSIILDSSRPRHPSAGRSLNNSRVKSSCLDLTLPTSSRTRDLSPSARPSIRTLMCSIIDSIHAPSHASPCARQRGYCYGYGYGYGYGYVGSMICSTFLQGHRSEFLASSVVETLTGVRPLIKSRTASSTAATRSSRGDGAMVTSPTAESSPPWPSSSGPPSLTGGKPNERRADRKRRCSSSWGLPRSERCCRAISTYRFRV
jgi:hypothetical protein